mmetsp:Transcript_55656/g.146965  ORF Transcript_55656/g.146965 Transcript_55656/m.146965 type:complete len:260 (+) Transcript_55656:621-1400(+)
MPVDRKNWGRLPGSWTASSMYSITSSHPPPRLSTNSTASTRVQAWLASSLTLAPLPRASSTMRRTFSASALGLSPPPTLTFTTEYPCPFVDVSPRAARPFKAMCDRAVSFGLGIWVARRPDSGTSRVEASSCSIAISNPAMAQAPRLSRGRDVPGDGTSNCHCVKLSISLKGADNQSRIPVTAISTGTSLPVSLGPAFSSSARTWSRVWPWKPGKGQHSPNPTPPHVPVTSTTMPSRSESGPVDAPPPPSDSGLARGTR